MEVLRPLAPHSLYLDLDLELGSFRSWFESSQCPKRAPGNPFDSLHLGAIYTMNRITASAPPHLAKIASKTYTVKGSTCPSFLSNTGTESTVISSPAWFIFLCFGSLRIEFQDRFNSVSKEGSGAWKIKTKAQGKSEENCYPNGPSGHRRKKIWNRM